MKIITLYIISYADSVLCPCLNAGVTGNSVQQDQVLMITVFGKGYVMCRAVALINDFSSMIRVFIISIAMTESGFKRPSLQK